MYADRFGAYRGKSVVVTGGTGFIGSRLCMELHRAGADVVAVDDCSNGNVIDHGATLRDIGVSVQVCGYQDMTLPADLAVVFHLACKKKASGSALEAFAREHVLDWDRFLRRLTEARPGCKVVYTSTGSVFEGAYDGAGEEESKRVTIPCPRSDYAITKLAAEHILHRYMDRGMIGSIARLYNVIGTGQSYGNDSGFLPTWCVQVLSGSPMTIHGDGTQVRTLTAVEDVVEALMVLGLRNSGRRVYTIASGQYVWIRQAAQRLLVEAGASGYETHGMVFNDCYDALDVWGDSEDLLGLLEHNAIHWFDAVSECWQWYSGMHRSGELLI